MEIFKNRSINENLEVNGLIREAYKVGSCGKNYKILKDGAILFTTRNAFTFFDDFRAFIADYEITSEQAQARIEVEINKYIRLCPTCVHFDGKTCDSCGFAYPLATDNNGLKPQEVEDCNIYTKKR